MRLSPLFLLLVALVVLPISHSFAQDEENYINYLNAKEYEIGAISVEGTKYLDKNVLIGISGLKVGDKISLPGDEVSKAIKNLWDQKLFTNVEIKSDKTIGNVIYLKIVLEERARLSRFQFEGVKGADLDELRKKLNITAGQIITENLKYIIHKTVTDYYKDKGYLTCIVNVTEGEDSILINSKLLTIAVDKGPKVKINQVTIHDAQNVDENKLKRSMKDTRERAKIDVKEILSIKKNRKDPRKWNFFRALSSISPMYAYEYLDRFVNVNIFKTSHFDENKYQKDKQNIIAAYNDEGYRDATIVKDSVYLVDDEYLNIDVWVKEGSQYYIRNIYWKGNQKFNDSTLSAIVKLEKGSVYSQKKLDERLFMSQAGNDLSSLYMDDGYLFFNVNPTELLIDGDSVDLEMRIFEGSQAVINNVMINGNTKTSEHVIRRELRVVPGNKFSRSDLIRSQREIANLGYFDPEQIEIIPYPNAQNGTVDVEFRVVEKPSDQLELSAGWGGKGTGIVGTAGVSFTNFSLRNIFNKHAWQPLPTGDGQRLSLRIQSNGKYYQSYNVSFTEPWLGGKKPNSLTLSFYHTRINNIDYNTENNDIIGYLKTTSGTVEFGTRLKWPDDFFTFIPSVNYQRYSLKNYTNSNFLFTDGKSHNLNLNLTLSRNSVDQPIYPTRGSNFVLSAQFTLPYSKIFESRMLDYTDPELPVTDRFKWLEYHKYKLKAEWYAPLSKNGKLVFKASAKMGFLFTYNKDLGLTPFERFELGGDGLSNVNYDAREIVSLRGYQVITPSVGAPIYNKYSFELRYPLSLNPSATIYALTFFEGGNYWNDIKRYNPIDLKRSVGAGVRIFLPMFGLLGFDYGIGFDDTPEAGSNIFSKYGEFRVILGFEPE